MTIDERKILSTNNTSIIQNLILENRGKLNVSGVVDVLSFDDQVVIIETELGLLTVKGENLKINKLNMVLVQMLLIFGLYLKKFSYYEFSLFNLQYILFQVLFALCSLLLILMYNGKKGKSSGKIKLMFYFFYPVHLIILDLLKFL